MSRTTQIWARLRRARMLLPLAVLTFVSSGCYYLPTAQQIFADDPTMRPWWCVSMNMADASHPYTEYEGMMKGELAWPDCTQVSAHFDLASIYAQQYPTAGAAEAAGFHRSVRYVAGMGTHHADMGTFSGEDMLSPDFNPLDPLFPGSPIDGVFDPNKPEFLQYGGNSTSSPLVGMSWYVRTENGLPPAGFVGDNDWWHRHMRLCFTTTTFEVIGEDWSDNTCERLGGINLHLQNYWMVHAWIVPGYEQFQDVFMGHHPCLVSGGPLPADDPCWTEGMPM